MDFAFSTSACSIFFPAQETVREMNEFKLARDVDVSSCLPVLALQWTGDLFKV